MIFLYFKEGLKRKSLYEEATVNTSDVIYDHFYSGFLVAMYSEVDMLILIEFKSIYWLIITS